MRRGASVAPDAATAARALVSPSRAPEMLVDGLSMREESVVDAPYRSLADIQLFGGSAGDGFRFQSTLVHTEAAA